MDDAPEELDFAVIGRFEGELPSLGEPALYRYMPYRSGAHYAMQQRLRSGEHVPCKLDAGHGVVLRFTVRACPDYGVLEIAGRSE
jgi:hypothetical protein